jgi:hypothetical protein
MADMSLMDDNCDFINKVNHNVDYLNDKLTFIKRELRKGVPYRLKENKKYIVDDQWIRAAVFGGKEKGVTTIDLEQITCLEN